MDEEKVTTEDEVTEEAVFGDEDVTSEANVSENETVNTPNKKRGFIHSPSCEYWDNY